MTDSATSPPTNSPATGAARDARLHDGDTVLAHAGPWLIVHDTGGYVIARDGRGADVIRSYSKNDEAEFLIEVAKRLEGGRRSTPDSESALQVAQEAMDLLGKVIRTLERDGDEHNVADHLHRVGADFQTVADRLRDAPPSEEPAALTESAVLSAFEAAGMRIELGGSPYSVRGQVAGLINGVRALQIPVSAPPTPAPDAAWALNLLQEEVFGQGDGAPPELCRALDLLRSHAGVTRNPRCGQIRHELDAYMWLRESTNEWVLEISGSIDDVSFVSRHPQPASTAPYDVPDLPVLYSRLAEAEDAARMPLGKAVAWALVRNGKVRGLGFERDDDAGMSTPLVLGKERGCVQAEPFLGWEFIELPNGDRKVIAPEGHAVLISPNTWQHSITGHVLYLLSAEVMRVRESNHAKD